MDKIIAQNKLAQIHFRSKGNPISTLPSSAISNCFPGLEYDFKNFWRRIFVGLVLLEWDNYVIGIEDSKFHGLLNHRLLKVNGRPIVTNVTGPSIPNGENSNLPKGKASVVTMEWSNALAFISSHHGKKVTCLFTKEVSPTIEEIPADSSKMLEVDLTVRQIFDEESLAISSEFLKAGELTQGLCSPWQHDYRECSCYYWPASRPDYVNVEPTSEGISRGDNWLSKNRTGDYVLDNRKDGRLVSYDDLFMRWEEELRFQIRGRDMDQ